MLLRKLFYVAAKIADSFAVKIAVFFAAKRANFFAAVIASTLHFVQKQKFSEAQSFLQQIIIGVIKCVLFVYISYCFHTDGTRL